MKLNIRNRLTISILGLFALIYIVSVGYVIYRMYNRNMTDAEKIVDASAREIANSVKSEIIKYIYITKGLAGSFETKDQFPENVNEEFQTILLEKALKDNPSLLSTFMSRQIFTYDPNWKHEYGRLKHTYFFRDGKIQLEKAIVDTEGEVKGSLYEYGHKTNKEYITEPYWDEYNNYEKILMTSICVPYEKNGIYQGMAGVDISLTYLKTLVNQYQEEYNQSSFILSTEATFIYSSDETKIGKSMKETDKILDLKNKISEKVKTGQSFSFYYTDTTDNKKYYYSVQSVNFGGDFTPWAIGVIVPKSVVLEEARSILYHTIFSGLLAMIIFFVAIYFIANWFTKPIKKVVEFSGEIANGNLKATIQLNDRADEYKDLQEHLKKMASNLQTVIEKVKANALTINDISLALRKISDELLTGTGRQAASAEEVSASMEQMIAMIEQNIVNADKTSSVAVKSVELIKDSEKSVSKTADLMSKIDTKIEELDEIAFQINLLALNTAIEASHAGEFGKGFTVVAKEVKKLAQKSKVAAKEISNLSSESVLISEQSVVSLKGIVPEISETANLVKDISISGKEQSGGAYQVNIAVNSLNTVIQQNAENADKMLASSKKIEKLSKEFNDLISFFRT